MKTVQKLKYSGIILFPVTFLVLTYLLNTFGIRIDEPILIPLLSLLPTVYTWSINTVAYRNGKREFGIFDAFNWRRDPYAQQSFKQKAMRPEIPGALKSKKPLGIIIGRSGSRYVVNDPKGDGAHHTLVVGTTGCGKTSTVILPTVLVTKEMAKLVVDIKGEISEKGEYLDDPKVQIIDPTDKSTFGYDPLYKLKSKASEQEIMDILSEIMYSIMPINAAEKNPFWSNSARDMFMGLSMFYIKSGITDLISIVDEILQKPIADAVEAVMNEADNTSSEYKYMVKFNGMAEETLSGVYAQLSNSITLFSNDYNIRHCLSENPLKTDPSALNKGKSIYLVIKEEKLSQYATLLHMIINQTISEMELRSEKTDPCLLIIDELARITSTGKIHKISDGLATLRSRNVSMLLVTQSIEALENAYSKSEVSAIMTNMPYKVILQASSSETQRDIIGWCGKYKEYKESYSRGGKSQSHSTSYEEKDIVNGADLMALPMSGDAILISPFGYNRVRKCPYYKDKTLSKRAQDIKNHNQKYKELRSEL